ncbi:hypothetical protein INT46_010127 [Mucor plumbeus]|uniref:Uncharacterized protein n=1 Tax=Mucor plumbeus TaxID=97098 RepID=A0A8H7QQJ8_9FUNG|nr:hypothetical protein INT46_010127 [Mucor plumbeus]
MSLVPTDFDYNRRFSNAIMDNTIDSTVLANYDQHTVSLIHFSGMENEDFIEFKNRILDYIGVKNIKDEAQNTSNTKKKRTIRRNISNTWCISINILNKAHRKSSKVWCSSGGYIHRKFKYRMLSEYYKHSMMNGTETHEEHLKLAQGYYKINHESKFATEPNAASVPVSVSTAIAPTLDLAIIKKLIEDIPQENSEKPKTTKRTTRKSAQIITIDPQLPESSNTKKKVTF